MNKYVLFLLAALIFQGKFLIAQSSGDYRTKASGDWSSAATWETFSGGSWINAVSAPTSSNGAINIQSVHTVTVSTNRTVDQVTINGNLIISNTGSSVTLTIADGTDSDLVVNNGAVFTNSAFSGGISITTPASWIVKSGGTYVHNSISDVNSPLVNSTLESGSNFIYRGSNSLTPSFAINGKTYSNLYLESTSGLLSLSTSGISTCTVTGDLNIGTTGNGTVSLDYSATSIKLIVIGNFIIGTSSSIITGSGNTTISGNLTNNGSISLGTGTLFFDGITTYSGNSISIAGSVTVNASKLLQMQQNLDIPTTKLMTVIGTLDCGTNFITGSGTAGFTLSSGATLKIGSTSGITTSGSTGNIQVSGTRSYNTSANYEYNGTAAQVFGSGLPATRTGNLVISNTTGVTLSNITVNTPGSVSVSGILNCGTNNISGTGSFTLSSGGTLGIGSSAGITSSGSSGNIQVTGSRSFSTGANYIYNGEVTQDAGNGLPATVNNLTFTSSSAVQKNLPSTSLTVSGDFISSGSSTVIAVNNLSVNGNFSVSGLSTFSAGSYTHSVKGNLTIDGTFNYQTSTLTLNGTSVQLLGGTQALQFNNLILNNSSGASLNKTTTVRKQLTLSSGQLNNSSFTFTVGDGISKGTISRASGSLTSSPTFNPVNPIIEYANSSGITTGLELPSSVGTLRIKTSIGSNSVTAVTINKNISINDSLNMVLGKVSPSSFTITLLTSAKSGCTQNSYIDGKLSQQFNSTSLTSKLLPIGKGIKNRPLILEIALDAANTTTFTAEQYNETPPSYSVSGMQNVSGNRWFSIVKTSEANITNANVTLSYIISSAGGDDEYITNDTSIVVAKVISNQWQSLGGTFVNITGTDGAKRSSTNFTDISTGTIGEYSSGFTYGSLNNNNPLPVELTSFTSLVSGRNVELRWVTASERNNDRFEVERKNISQGNVAGWYKIGSVNGSGTVNTQTNYFCNDKTTSGRYLYRLKQLDFNGDFKYHNLINEVIVDLPEKFNLSQNYPNPFNPSTKIDFELPVEGNVTMKLYDMTGREAVVLIEGEKRTAGYYTVQFNNNSLASGTYFYKIKIEGSTGFEMTRKMMLIR
jgi:hypothetical protein